MSTTELELFFITLMEEKGVENEGMLNDFYDWVVDTIEYACDDYKADAGWEEEDEDD